MDPATPSHDASQHPNASEEVAADDEGGVQLMDDGAHTNIGQAAVQSTAAPNDDGDSQPAAAAADSWTYRETPQVCRRM